MKILHVSPSYFPAIQFGGPIQSVHLLNKTLVENEIVVDVFTTNAGLDKTEFRSKNWKIINGVRIKYFSYLGYIHYNFSLSLLFSLFRAVSQYDLVHITAVWNFPVLAASLACRWHKIPYIISPRGTIYPETIAIKSSNFKKIYYTLFAKTCLEGAAALHFTALDEEIKVKEYLHLDTLSAVIPNGIDVAEFERNLENQTELVNGNSPYILFLGRINYKKGLDILFRAFAEIKKANSGLKLAIVGPDSDGYKIDLDLLAKDLGVTSDIIYYGQLEGEAKLAMYQNAFCFVLPSYSENFGMSVVEAMASNCPVVISNKVGIFEDILENEAGLVTNTDHIEVANAVLRLLDDHSLKSKLQENGLHMVKKLYSIHSVAKRFITLYKTLVK